MDLSLQQYNSCDRCREGKIEEPEILCYYHQKMHNGLIDEPESEIAYSDIWSEDCELVQIFVESCKIIANKMCYGDEIEDATQYAGLKYRHALSTWDSRNSSWVTWCSNIIRNSITDFMRKKVLYGSRFEFISELLQMPDTDIPDAESLVLEKERIDNLRSAIASAMGDMTARQTSVLWNRLVTQYPATQQSIADDWNTTRQSIMRDEESIIKILRKEIDYEIQNRYLR